MSLNEKFSDRLKARMNRVNLQQNELAERCGVHASAVSNWMTGANEAKGRNLRRLAEILDCDAAWLRDGAGTIETISTVRQTHSELRDGPVREGANPLEQEAREHLEKFLGTCRGDVRRLGWAVTELEARLPLDKWAAADARPGGEPVAARYEAGPGGQVRKVDPEAKRQGEELMRKAMLPDAAVKKGKA